MKRSSKTRSLLVVVIVTLGLVCPVLGSETQLISEFRPMNLLAIDDTNSDSLARYSSYRAAIDSIFPEVDSLDLRIRYEVLRGEDGGTVVQFEQMYYGLPVWNGAGAWLRAPDESKAVWGGVHCFQDIMLGTPGYLADTASQSALQTDAASLCPDLDSITWVRPIVYAVYDSASDYYDYTYALVVSVPYPVMDRIVDWDNGDTLQTLDVYHLNVHFQVEHRVTGATGEAPVTDDAYGNARVKSCNNTGCYDWHVVSSEGNCYGVEEPGMPWWIVGQASNGIYSVLDYRYGYL